MLLFCRKSIITSSPGWSKHCGVQPHRRRSRPSPLLLLPLLLSLLRERPICRCWQQVHVQRCIFSDVRYSSTNVAGHLKLFTPCGGRAFGREQLRCTGTPWPNFCLAPITLPLLETDRCCVCVPEAQVAVVRLGNMPPARQLQFATAHLHPPPPTRPPPCAAVQACGWCWWLRWWCG